MSILVTGGAGYIGSQFAHELVDVGSPVVVLDDLSTGRAWAVPKRAILVEGDVGDEELVKKIVLRHNVEAIVHFAGSIVVPTSLTNPLGYYLNNTVNSHALIAAAVSTGIQQFIFS